MHFFCISIQSDLLHSNMYDIIYEEDQATLYNILLNPNTIHDPQQSGTNKDNYVTFTCHIKRESAENQEKISFESVQLIGYFRKYRTDLFIYQTINFFTR